MKGVRRARRGLAAVGAAILVGTLAGAGAGGARPTVMQVVSPDTLVVRLAGGRRATVRLVGVVAPARRSCHFAEATAAVRRLALRKPVTLTADPGLPARDGAGRLPRYVALPDGWDLGQRLVRDGHVLVQPETRPFARREVYVPYEQAAALSSSGMWLRCIFRPAPRRGDRADLAVTVGVTTPDPLFGAQITVVVTNYGPRSAGDVAVEVRLPAGATLRSATGEPSVRRFDVGVLRPGESERLDLTYDPGAAGAAPVSVLATSTAADPNPANDAASATPSEPPLFGGPPPPPPPPWQDPPPTDVALAASATPDRVAIGGRLTYSLRVENKGPRPTFQPRLLVPLPAGTSVVSIARSRGTCYRHRSSVVCLFGTLEPGRAATARVVLRVTAAARGLLHVQTAPRVEALDRPDNEGANNFVPLVTPIGRA